MNVLSLFDGMSCGQIALQKLGVTVDKYYASELDKYAIQVTQKNFPNTIQLGDVTKWREWDIDWASIDLLQGGSPCQGFSFAGKQLAFDDPRSKLFFVYVDILNHIKQHKPNVKFLLENVRMKKEYLDVISEYLVVQPVLINSALVSAQNRNRYYWTNICELQQPEDKGIILKDILEYGKEDVADLVINQGTDATRLDIQKGSTLLARDYKGFGNQAQTGVRLGHLLHVGDTTMKGHDSMRRVYSESGKAPTVTAMGGGNLEPKVAISDKKWRKLTPLECERLQTVPDGYTSSVSNSQRYKMLGNGWTVDVITHIYKSLL